MDANILSGLVDGLSGLGKYLTGTEQINNASDYESSILTQAGQQALQAGQYSAAVYRQAKVINDQTVQYNLSVEQYNANIQNDAMSKNMRNMFATNRAMMGGSGISFGSGSYMSVQAAALDNMTNKAIQMNNASVQRQKMISYQGLLTDYNYENNARQAEYQAQVSQVNYENQAKAAQYKAELANESNASSGIGSLVSVGQSLIGAFK